VTRSRETVIERVLPLCRQVLAGDADGLRFTELISRVCELDSSLNRNTMRWIISQLGEQGNLEKTPEGFYRLAESEDLLVREPQSPVVSPGSKESDFYEPFAEWLMDRGECTYAVSLGGSKFGGKWATPDVIGKKESRRSDIIQFPIEIVSAEIKSDSNQLITAFGQSCAYCLFSHKSYLVVPQNAKEEDIVRLDSLSQVLGIGLVLFDSLNINAPNFDIRVRAKRQEPDRTYVNSYAKQIEKELFGNGLRGFAKR